MSDWRHAFEKARERRQLGPDTTAYRAFHGPGEGAPEVCVDWFDAVAVVSFYATWPKEREDRCLEQVVSVFQPRALYLKRRPLEARESVKLPPELIAPLTPWFGEEVPVRSVFENGRRFSIRPANGLSVGLYLDAREARQWVFEKARGKTVLNCFAYTCGFGIAATAGGALRAVNVDVSRKVLDWGEENARLNGQEVSRKDFIAGDVFDWLQRFSRKQERFDLVVLDPPSFSNTRQSRFSAAKDYGRLVAAALGAVAPGGRVLACCNLSTLDKESFRSLVFQAVREAGRTGKVEAEMGASPRDFPMPKGQDAPLKVLSVALK